MADFSENGSDAPGSSILLVNRPLLPEADKLLPYLRQIDSSRYYSNYGPLHERLVERLAIHFGISRGCLTLAGSGTSALAALILAVCGRAKLDRPLCICSAYTFVATAVAASVSGYQPFFADVGPESWSLEPDRLTCLPQLAEAGLVVVTAPYGRTPDVLAWQNFSRNTGLPVIIDAAACFDTIDAAVVCSGTVPVAISLHATKTFSTAEGGMVLAGDPELVKRTEQALNFGFYGSRESIGPSINGKLSEYHAAVGLAELDSWPEKRARFLRAAALYREAAGTGLSSRIVADVMRALPYVLLLAATAEEASAIKAELDGAAIDSRLWYGLGLAAQPYYRNCPSELLSVTSDLAPRLIGLPFAADIDSAAVARVMAVVARVVRP